MLVSLILWCWQLGTFSNSYSSHKHFDSFIRANVMLWGKTERSNIVTGNYIKDSIQMLEQFIHLITCKKNPLIICKRGHLIMSLPMHFGPDVLTSWEIQNFRFNIQGKFISYILGCLRQKKFKDWAWARGKLHFGFLYYYYIYQFYL